MTTSAAVSREHPRVKRSTTTPERSALMARVRQTGTAPELLVRSILRRHGFGFQITGIGLPGSPDVFDPAGLRAIFVHGCYWHRHVGCRATTTPKTNRQYWLPKFEANVARDRRKVRQLRKLGYRVMIIWECQVKSAAKRPRLERRLLRFFGAQERT